MMCCDVQNLHIHPFAFFAVAVRDNVADADTSEEDIDGMVDVDGMIAVVEVVAVDGSAEFCFFWSSK
jgi:hypothetical protein